jgi:hypothetical protein
LRQQHDDECDSEIARRHDSTAPPIRPIDALACLTVFSSLSALVLAEAIIAAAEAAT